MKLCPICCPKEERRPTIYDKLAETSKAMRLSLRDAKTLDKLSFRYDLKIDTGPIKKNAEGNARNALVEAATLAAKADADPFVVLRYLRT